MEKEIPSYYAIIPAEVRYSNIPANAKLLYGEITALCNKIGICFASNDYFAKLYRVEKRTITRWIKDLIDNKFITAEYTYKKGSKEIENRCIKLASGGIVKNVTGYSQKCLEGINKNVLDNNTRVNNKEIYKESFEQWWKEYPRKIDKKKALEKFTSILADKKATLEELLTGAKKYALHCQEEKTEEKYIKHPTTWLNGECWQNEYTTATPEDYRKKYELF